MQRTYDTSFKPDKLISPPDMSPICNPLNNLANNSLRSRKSVTRLDFSAHMSVDSSYLEEKENDNPQLAANQGKMDKIQFLYKLVYLFTGNHAVRMKLNLEKTQIQDL